MSDLTRKLNTTTPSEEATELPHPTPLTNDGNHGEKRTSDALANSGLRPELHKAARASWQANKKVYLTLKDR